MLKVKFLSYFKFVQMVCTNGAYQTLPIPDLYFHSFQKMGNPDWNCPLTYHSKIQRFCRCRASHSLILSLSHLFGKTVHLSTALHLLGFYHQPSEGSVLRDHLPHVLLRSAYLQNRFPSSFLVAGSQ